MRHRCIRSCHSASGYRGSEHEEGSNCAQGLAICAGNALRDGTGLALAHACTSDVCYGLYFIGGAGEKYFVCAEQAVTGVNRF